MCYPIVKEQDFPARRKGLQTNPDYRAPQAFCQTLSPKNLGGDNRAGVEKNAKVCDPAQTPGHQGLGVMGSAEKLPGKGDAVARPWSG